MMEVVTTNFTKKHSDISHSFVQRIIGLLQSEGLETDTYGIDLKYYNGEQESIKLTIGENITITIQVVTKK